MKITERLRKIISNGNPEPIRFFAVRLSMIFIGILIPITSHAATLNWTDNGNQSYQITGNVGIGTTTPAAVLDVYGNPVVFESALLQMNPYTGNASSSISFSGSRGSVGYDSATFVTQGMSMNVQSGTGKGIEFITNQSAFGQQNSGQPIAMYITSGRNVGIGTTTPQAQFTTTGTVQLYGIPNCTYGLKTDSQGYVSCISSSASTVDNPIQDLYEGLILMFISLWGTIWIFKKR